MLVVAPRAESIFTTRHMVVGIALQCPECPERAPSLLRVEVPKDRPETNGLMPDLDLQDHRLGFIARCDRCGFRVHMKGDRLPTVAMLKALRPLGERSDSDGDG